MPEWAALPASGRRGGWLGGWGSAGVGGRCWNDGPLCGQPVVRVLAGCPARLFSKLPAHHPTCSLLPPPCSHSLGGALAVLATSAIRRQHPDSEITVYTLGCPRVRPAFPSSLCLPEAARVLWLRLALHGGVLGRACRGSVPHASNWHAAISRLTGRNAALPPPLHSLPPEQVFTSAGAREFNAGVPDCWSLINGTDPVAWIPKVGAGVSWQRLAGCGRRWLAGGCVRRAFRTSGAVASSLTAGEFVESGAAVMRCRRGPPPPRPPSLHPLTVPPLPSPPRPLGAVGLQAGGPAREPGCGWQPGAAAHLL